MLTGRIYRQTECYSVVCAFIHNTCGRGEESCVMISSIGHQSRIHARVYAMLKIIWIYMNNVVRASIIVAGVFKTPQNMCWLFTYLDGHFIFNNIWCCIDKKTNLWIWIISDVPLEKWNNQTVILFCATEARFCAVPRYIWPSCKINHELAFSTQQTTSLVNNL